MTPRPDSITDVPGIRVGHREVEGGGSGCTVVLGPFRARVRVDGMAAGTRELGTLAEGHITSRADALLLTGGSAFGLAAAQGVSEWLEERGEGHVTRVARVPIVPAAVLFDLAPGRRRPGPDDGRAACDAAGADPVPSGRVGAGTGATVGKLLGIERASPGGVGSAASRLHEWTAGALAVVNAIGDVVGRDGSILAGPRDGDGTPADGTAAVLARGRSGAAIGLREGENTTLAVVATDAPLSSTGLARVLRVAATGIARRISPVHTPFDGDVVFAVSTASEVRPVGSEEILVLGVALREALETAIVRAVGAGEASG